MRRAGRSETLVMLLAGGEGERLYPLTKKRAKPAVRFGGVYCIIDFTLSNCVNSGLTRIYVLTQHKSLPLDRHVRDAWGFLHPDRGEFIQTVPPQLHLVSRWYAGTSDAVFQNLDLLDEERPRNVLVLSGDHVYRMDYGRLLAFHAERGADLTVACTRVPLEEARRMGVLGVDEAERVTVFDEKPPFPTPIAPRVAAARVNMGIYVFRTEPLVRALVADAKTASRHDFGHCIIPAMVPDGRVFAYDVGERGDPTERYWQDVGTLDTYYATNMELLAAAPAFDLHAADWPIRHGGGQHPPAVLRSAGGREARVSDSIVSPGCIVRGASVTRSILAPGVVVEEGARIDASILMPGVRVGPGTRLERAIVDEHVTIPHGIAIGAPGSDRRHFTVTEGGVTVVPEGTLIDP
ncbi:MAG: NTP transferase domain-containing protein [Deltaproteobacteria bacterium]|nr:NTP transferase domain-containing protein [Deltaproteobacteria bacterium]